MSNEVKSALLSMGVPFVGVIGGIVVLHDSTARVAGFPILFAWLFLWMPLTSVCLHLAWTWFDADEEHPAAALGSDATPTDPEDDR